MTFYAQNVCHTAHYNFCRKISATNRNLAMFFLYKKTVKIVLFLIHSYARNFSISKYNSKFLLVCVLTNTDIYAIILISNICGGVSRPHDIRKLEDVLMNKTPFWPKDWGGRIAIGVSTLVLVLLLLIFVVEAVRNTIRRQAIAAVGISETTIEAKRIAQKFAENTEKRWKVLSRSMIPTNGSGKICEYLLSSNGSYLIVREPELLANLSNIGVGDTVKLKRATGLYDDKDRHPNDPFAYELRQ